MLLLASAFAVHSTVADDPATVVVPAFAVDPAVAQVSYAVGVPFFAVHHAVGSRCCRICLW